MSTLSYQSADDRRWGTEMMFRIPIRHHVFMQGQLLDTRQWLVRSVC